MTVALTWASHSADYAEGGTKRPPRRLSLTALDITLNGIASSEVNFARDFGKRQRRGAVRLKTSRWEIASATGTDCRDRVQQQLRATPRSGLLRGRCALVGTLRRCSSSQTRLRRFVLRARFALISLRLDRRLIGAIAAPTSLNGVTAFRPVRYELFAGPGTFESKPLELCDESQKGMSVLRLIELLVVISDHRFADRDTPPRALGARQAFCAYSRC